VKGNLQCNDTSQDLPAEKKSPAATTFGDLKRQKADDDMRVAALNIVNAKLSKNRETTRLLDEKLEILRRQYAALSEKEIQENDEDFARETLQFS